MALIVNSHLEQLLPKPWLAVDGLLGNQVFFILAGYAAGRSLRDGCRSPLGFFLRRLRGTAIPLALTVTGAAFLGLAEAPASFAEWLKRIVWPTEYGFIRTVVPLWLMTPILPARGGYQTLTALAATCFFGSLGAQVVNLEPGENISLGELSPIMWSMYWSLSFGLGLCAAQMTGLPYLPKLERATAVMVSLSGYCASKLAYYYSEDSRAIGLAVMFVAAIVFNSLLLTSFSSKRLERAMSRCRPWLLPLSAITLHVYLTHTYVIEPIVDRKWPWALAMPVYFTVVLAIGFALRLADRCVVSALATLFPSPTDT